MRVSREQAVQSRERIVAVASRRFREVGFGGIGVADVMREAGFTHGGFYGHFSSKEDLIAQACAHGIGESEERWRKRIAARPDDALAAMTRFYLNTQHRDNPGDGCTMAALATEAARQGPEVRGAFTEGLRSAFASIAALIRARDPAEKRRKAIHTYASWVGAMVLARATEDAKLSREILDAVARETS